VARDEQAVDAVLDDVADAADVHRDRRPAAEEGLDEHTAEPFRPRRKDEARRFVERVCDLRLRQPLRPRGLRRQLMHELLDHRPPRAAADDAQLHAAQPLRGEPPRTREAVDVLVELEHSDEQCRGLRRERHGRTLAEELEVHERGELRGGLDAELAHEPARVRRDRANGVRPAEAVRADRVGERRERAPERRPVEARRRAPVAVQLDDDPRTHPCEPQERRLVRALRHDRVRAMRGRDPTDAKRQQHVEQQAVESREPADEVEGAVVARPAVRRGREHAHLEPLAKRRELPLEARRQRQLVSRARDEEHAWLRHSSFCTVATTRSANSSGDDSHRDDSSCAAAPSRSASPGSARTRAIAPASASASPGSTSNPVRSCSTMSGIPPARAPTTPRPRRNASIATRPRPSAGDGSTSARAASSARATAGGSRYRSHCAPSAASAAATAVCVPLPTMCSRASGSRATTSRHAAASSSTFLYRSSIPTNSSRGSAGTGAAGPAKAPRSENVGKTPTGSRPSRRTSDAVNDERARWPSACLTAQPASASPTGAAPARRREPYRRVDVRQSPCTSTSSFARERVVRRAISAATASYGLSATITSGSNARSSRATSKGSDA